MPFTIGDSGHTTEHNRLLNGLYSSAPDTVYMLPQGVLVGYTWGGVGAFSSTTTNSSQTVVEVIFDTGKDSMKLTSLSVWCDLANDGAGAALNFGVYSLTSPLGRTLISAAGSVLIGTTGAKTSTFAAIIVPRQFAVHLALSSLNTAGANPNFGFIGSSPIPRVYGAAQISQGNNSTKGQASAAQATVSTKTWPSTNSMTVTRADPPTIVEAGFSP
jgi:hypothetical protein